MDCVVVGCFVLRRCLLATQVCRRAFYAWKRLPVGFARDSFLSVFLPENLSASGFGKRPTSTYIRVMPWMVAIRLSAFVPLPATELCTSVIFFLDDEQPEAAGLFCADLCTLAGRKLVLWAAWVPIVWPWHFG